MQPVITSCCKCQGCTQTELVPAPGVAHSQVELCWPHLSPFSLTDSSQHSQMVRFYQHRQEKSFPGDYSVNNSHANHLKWGNGEQEESGLRKEASFTSQLLQVHSGIKLAIRGS